MALTFGDNISYQGKKPLDSRSIFKTIADMKAYSENYLPPLAMCQNEEDGKTYTYNVNNESTELTGKWRVLEGSGGGTADVPIEKIKVNGELQTPVNKVVDITVPDAYDDTALVQRISDIESDYAKSSDIPSLSGYATETWVNEQGFLTQHQDLSNYATKDELPSLDGYATESYVTEQISNIPSVDLTDYAKKNEIPDVSGYITEEQLLAKDYADKAYVTEEIAKASTGGEIDLSTYLSKVEATETYVTKESGKSLIADTEIERLASVDNYDDTEIDNRIRAIEDDYIKNTDLAAVAKSGSYNDLADTPSIPSIEGLAKTEDIPTKVSELENDSNYLSSIPEEYVTDTELEAKGYLTEHQDISNLVEKEDGKGLSSNDYTTEEKNKLELLENYDDSVLTEKIQAIEDDYLTSVQKEELVNSITELDTKITDGLEEKLDAVQSVDNAGKFLVVGDDGTVTFAEHSATSGDSAENIAYVNDGFPDYTNVGVALDSILAKIYYVAPKINSFTMTPSTTEYEIGTVIPADTITFSWEVNKDIKSQALTDCTIAIDDRSATYGSELKNTKTFVLTVSDGENAVTASKKISFLNKAYWGNSVEPDEYNSAFILGLSNNKLISSSKCDYTMNVGAGEYGYFAVPTTMKFTTIWVNGFQADVNEVATVSFTNASGNTASYTVLRTSQTGLGAFTATVK